MTYDDQSFYESLSGSFAAKKSLHPVNLPHLKNVLPVTRKNPCRTFPEGLAEAKEAKEEKTDVKCPKCDAMIVKKVGKRGPFYACSAFPKCRNIANSLDGIYRRQIKS